ncbi:hypothetical protein H6804_00190 [Candidatus Nomurabacteria bacterium]|nr:hypothetical protein [Candidatus Nomurabacteria bacterium]HXK52999.1 hypothetical protein [bacterium]
MKGNRKLNYAITYGVLFGLVDASLMLPLEFENKALAMTGAFLQRFAIGFLIPYINLPLSGTLKGIFSSFLISIPTAVITGSYIPIITTGVIGGAIIGWHSEKIKYGK